MKKHFVSRYKWSHDSRRRTFRKLLKKGQVKLIQRLNDGWLYEEVSVSISFNKKGQIKIKYHEQQNQNAKENT